MRPTRLNFNNLIDDYKQKYKNIRNKYVTSIRRTKKLTWKSFITVEGNRDPWSLIYKIIRNKINKEDFLCSVKLPSGEVTKSWNETVKILLEKCAPKDEIDIETEEQRLLKLNNAMFVNENLEPDITQDEIINSIKKCKSQNWFYNFCMLIDLFCIFYLIIA